MRVAVCANKRGSERETSGGRCRGDGGTQNAGWARVQREYLFPPRNARACARSVSAEREIQSATCRHDYTLWRRSKNKRRAGRTTQQLTLPDRRSMLLGLSYVCRETGHLLFCSRAVLQEGAHKADFANSEKTPWIQRVVLHSFSTLSTDTAVAGKRRFSCLCLCLRLALELCATSRVVSDNSLLRRSGGVGRMQVVLGRGAKLKHGRWHGVCYALSISLQHQRPAVEGGEELTYVAL